MECTTAIFTYLMSAPAVDSGTLSGLTVGTEQDRVKPFGTRSPDRYWTDKIIITLLLAPLR